MCNFGPHERALFSGIMLNCSKQYTLEIKIVCDIECTENDLESMYNSEWKSTMSFHIKYQFQVRCYDVLNVGKYIC